MSLGFLMFLPEILLVVLVNTREAENGEGVPTGSTPRASPALHSERHGSGLQIGDQREGAEAGAGVHFSWL